MDLLAVKKEITNKIKKMQDRDLLDEIGWLLDNDLYQNPKLMESLERGIKQADRGEGAGSFTSKNLIY